MNTLKNPARFAARPHWVHAFGSASTFAAPAQQEPLASRRVAMTCPGRWKRSLDFACLLLGLPGLLVLFGVITLFLKVTAPGPVFFVQERVGFRKKRFRCLKFRTMNVGADSRAHQEHLKRLANSERPMAKLDAVGDPRLIPGGRFLRATGLDELPQIINVVRGEMSLVGPRPCTGYELENFGPADDARFEALPGLTGLWQVSGKNKTTFREMVRLDIEYAQRQSLWLDLKIMASTWLTLVGQVKELRASRFFEAEKRNP